VSVLPGVRIGKGAIVGALSTVTRDIPPYSIAVGSPARIIKRFNFDSEVWERV
jgi:acetyltransferase-like isoleucine patch superfamily enzyme